MLTADGTSPSSFNVLVKSARGNCFLRVKSISAGDPDNKQSERNIYKRSPRRIREMESSYLEQMF